MVDHTPTLTWLEGVLDEIGLGLDHVIIMDLLPMLTDNWLGEYPAERDKVIPEMLKLTLDLFESSSYILSSLVNAFTISGMSAEVLYHAERPDNRKKGGQQIAELLSSKVSEKSFRDLEDLAKREYLWIS
ncbi:hypothetical protein E8E15_001289 [Penicillium rubens]|uniref:Uncharacterized protein n=1 Tax=Penicillium chrysogenum TaxID=5076 RepID=A0A161Z427_PENCH|nr:hypothetical protein E8E15_001289 [Penicillium rubens]KZN84106.1 hypothetical protein EN45_112240 [Penicillium chrysogenum]